MKVWELRFSNVNDFSMIVPVTEDLDKFETDGRPLQWMSRPVVQYVDSRSRGKNKRPVADVAAGGPGNFFLSKRAYEVLGPFLGQFGQLLEVQTWGGAEFRHFYNVTNIVKCVDVQASERHEWGAVKNEVFYDINIPRTASVFKDPATANRRMYTNDPGRTLLERLAAEAGLTGLECGEPKKR